MFKGKKGVPIFIVILIVVLTYLFGEKIVTKVKTWFTKMGAKGAVGSVANSAGDNTAPSTAK